MAGGIRLPALAAALLLGLVGGTAAESPGDTFKDCAACPEMVVVPAGSFRMGDLNGAGYGVEGPVHDVRIGHAFAVGIHEVTFAEWDACVAAGGCSYRPGDEGWGRGRRPVVNVSWDDAQAHARWLNRMTGKTYRLLTEAEWEYVARAATRSRYPWGDGIDGSRARYASREGTAPVGTFAANGFGVHDTAGNAWEWVQDCWHEGYAGAPADGAAWTGDGECGPRVRRGGSWRSIAGVVRSAVRYRSTGDRRTDAIGYRLARNLD